MSTAAHCLVHRSRAHDCLRLESRLTASKSLTANLRQLNVGEVARDVRGEAPRARSGLPAGRGRGSSVSSIICYLIGLSHIDPVKNNLFLGRFLNEALRKVQIDIGDTP